MISLIVAENILVCSMIIISIDTFSDVTFGSWICVLCYADGYNETCHKPLSMFLIKILMLCNGKDSWCILLELSFELWLLNSTERFEISGWCGENSYYVSTLCVFSLHRRGGHSHSGLVHWLDVCHRPHHPHSAHRLLHQEEPWGQISR